MINASRARAHNQFAAIEKRQQKALSEQDEVLAAQRKKTERLREMRLAKEQHDQSEKERIKLLKAARPGAKRRSK